jgi:methyl-accepting chemotaxis protein
MKLRGKLLLAFGSLLLLTVLLVSCFFYILQKVNIYQQTSEDVDGINIRLLEMNASVNQFIFEGYKSTGFHRDLQSPFLQDYASNLERLKQELVRLESVSFMANDSSVRAVHTSLDDLEVRFKDLVQLLHQRGFKDFGLEGELRKAIHAVENTSFPYDKAGMLTLRRHEKDFFLRKDTAYARQFNNKLEAFILPIQSGPAEESRDMILKNLENYRDRFNEVVSIETRIGLTETQGIKRIINEDLHHLKHAVQVLRSTVKEKSHAFRQRAMALLIGIFILQLAAGVVLAFTYSDRITRSITELQRAMKDFSEGIFPPRLPVKSHEEIGQARAAFNQLLDRMKAAQEFAESLGNGNLNTAYDHRFTSDSLAQAMRKMQHQLITAQEKQEIIHWSNAGAAQLNDILKAESASIQALGDQIIKWITNYLGANQGALYIVQHDDQEEYLERIATFAYGKKKYVEQRIGIGSGLAGQCALERSTILLTEVPQHYIRITSGLGEAVPRCVVITPLMARDNVMGIVELASFHVLQPHQVEFLEKISGNIASIIANKRTQEETQRLLAETRRRASRLQSQEEELPSPSTSSSPDLHLVTMASPFIAHAL